MSDILIHKILNSMKFHKDFYVKTPEIPFWIQLDTYKRDTRALYSSLQRILDEELAKGFEIVEYTPTRGMRLNLDNLLITEEGNQLLNMTKFQIRSKVLFNKAVDKFHQFQEDMDAAQEKYENYSDEQLIRMVKSNNFPKPSHRVIVARILINRGYGKENTS